MRLRPGPTAATFDLRLTGVPAGAMLSVVADRVDGGPVLAGRWLVPSGTVRSRLFYGLRHLRAMFESGQFGDDEVADS